MKKILICIPTELLSQVDQYSKDNNYNRSELIRHALRLLIKEKHAYEKPNKETV